MSSLRGELRAEQLANQDDEHRAGADEVDEELLGSVLLGELFSDKPMFERRKLIELTKA